MTFIKKLLKKYDKPLQQLTKRYLERNISYIPDKEEFSVKFHMKHTNGPLTEFSKTAKPNK